MKAGSILSFAQRSKISESRSKLDSVPFNTIDVRYTNSVVFHNLYLKLTTYSI